MEKGKVVASGTRLWLMGLGFLICIMSVPKSWADWEGLMREQVQTRMTEERCQHARAVESRVCVCVWGQGMGGEMERRAEGQELEMGCEAFCTVGQLLVSPFAHLYIHPLILQQLWSNS